MLNRIRASKQNGLCACGGVAHPRRRKFGRREEGGSVSAVFGYMDQR